MGARTWRSRAGFEGGSPVRWSEGAEESLSRIVRNFAPEWRRLLTEPGSLPAGPFKAGWLETIRTTFFMKSDTLSAGRRHPDIPSFTPLHAIELIEEADALVVDVRSSREFLRIRIRGSVHVPATELTGTLPRLIPGTGKLLIFVDESGELSADAASEAARLGYSRAGYLHGGLKFWRTERLPVVRG